MSQPYDSQPKAELSPDLFISYARRDYDQVRRITDEFTAMEVSFWLDQQDIDGGENFAEVIARSVRLSRVFVLMCSDAALRSRNVKKEIILAWKYERPYLPLLLERVSFPEQIEYFLEGVQWIEIIDQPALLWLPPVRRALAKVGGVNAGSIPPSAIRSTAVPPEESASTPEQTPVDLSRLRALASFNDCIWPIAAAQLVVFGSALTGPGT